MYLRRLARARRTGQSAERPFPLAHCYSPWNEIGRLKFSAARFFYATSLAPHLLTFPTFSTLYPFLAFNAPGPHAYSPQLFSPVLPRNVTPSRSSTCSQFSPLGVMQFIHGVHNKLTALLPPTVSAASLGAQPIPHYQSPSPGNVWSISVKRKRFLEFPPRAPIYGTQSAIAHERA